MVRYQLQGNPLNEKDPAFSRSGFLSTRMTRIRPETFASFVPSRYSRSMTLALFSILEKTISEFRGLWPAYFKSGILFNHEQRF